MAPNVLPPRPVWIRRLTLAQAASVLVGTASLAGIGAAWGMEIPPWSSMGWLPLAGMLLLGVLSRFLALARFHYHLRAADASVHLSATARLLAASSWLRWIPVFQSRGGTPASAAKLNHLWFSIPVDQGVAAEARDRLLALEWGGRAGARSSIPWRDGSERDLLLAKLSAWGEWATWGMRMVLGLSVVGSEPIPWLHLLWILPATRLLGGLTFLSGGFGLRELFLVVALHQAGVSDPFAMAFPILLQGGLVALLGPVVGCWVMVHEAAVRGRREDPRREPTHGLSVVMPVLNEANQLANTVERLRRIPELLEIILVDGGSRDGTAELGGRLGCRVLITSPGRGHQMRAGAAVAAGDVVVLVHADTWLNPDAGRMLRRCLQDPTVVAGGFWKRFDATPWMLKGSRPKCLVRWWVGRRIVGDMAMFIRRSSLEAIGGVPDMELMEDFELSARLRRLGRLALADSTVVTSSRRFIEKGVLRTYLKMWRVATLYRLGKSPAELRKLYG